VAPRDPVTALDPDKIQRLLGLLFASHPWHGLTAGAEAPAVVTVYVELVPADTVKYEIEKRSGLLKLDRPQRYSSVSPEPYGFVPRTLCDTRVAALAGAAVNRSGLRGDQDPLDICVLTERALNHGGIIVRARPIGGLRMFDGEEVDDKIIAVLESDPTYETWSDIADCPRVLVDRIQHYFLTYKDMPGTAARRIELAGVYGAETARDVIAAAEADYRERFGDLELLLAEAVGATGR
jgi:inorganic pyrophosphatase